MWNLYLKKDMDIKGGWLEEPVWDGSRKEGGGEYFQSTLYEDMKRT
jgi:hypothetical protein